MDQQALFHEDINDALRAAIRACGGTKAVSTKLWPGKPVTEAQSYLNDCINPPGRRGGRDFGCAAGRRAGRGTDNRVVALVIPGLPAPLPPSTEPDADRERAADSLRRKLAEGNLHPSRRRLMERELETLERAA